MSRLAVIVLALSLVSSLPWQVEAQTSLTRTEVSMWLPAVGQRSDGTLFGVASSLEVTMQAPGSGQVFLSTTPHTQIDMQGSARLAVVTAGAIAGASVADKDFFFSVDTDAVTVGGPSGGGAMAVAVTALLKGWTVRSDVIMTGMIDPDGSIGPIGGILQKVEAADSVGASTFLIPLGQGTQTVQNQQTGAVENVDVKAYARDNFDIEIIEVADLFDAIPPFTENRLIRPEPSIDPLQDAAYAAITGRLGTNLTDEAQRRLASITSRYAAAQGDIDSNRAVIDEQLSTARDRVASARNAQNQSRQYLAASLAFQALIAIGYAEALVTFYEGNSSDAAYLDAYLAETDRRSASIGQAIRVTYPIPAARLDAQAAAEQRQLEALDLQAAARAAQREGRGLTSLQSSSFARERAESARWWHQIGLDVGNTTDGPTVTEAALGVLTQQYAETAQLQLEYTGLIAPGEPAYRAAQAALASSESARAQGRLAASLFDLVEVFAQTNTALVSIAGDDPVRQRLDRVADAAAYQIELAQSEGALPVYATSLLELAESRIADEPTGAFTAYSTARLSARASMQAAGIQTPAPRDEPVGRGILSELTGSWWIVGYLVGSSILVLVAAGWLLRQRPAPTRRPIAEPEPSPAPQGTVLVTPPPADPVPLLPAPAASLPASAPDEETNDWPSPPVSLPDDEAVKTGSVSSSRSEDAMREPKAAPKRRAARRAPTSPARRPRPRRKPDREPDTGKP